ncbi:MAG: cysteine desulfurase [Flavobacteriales bacterium]|nr:Cysteine desulfurase NifS [Flavobacteriales bacterium]MCC6577112.1 cysteine desulfurase [Flavobacteriales bacterium]NUQ15581.1 cysteine desulfurase [Flavobacteriales bacterium]
MNKIYLDNAATTPLAPEVLEVMTASLREEFGNPSSIHAFGRRSRAAVERARRTVADLLHCMPGDIVFTSGGTEADNMALVCGVRDRGVQHLITSPVEHHAIELTAHELAHRGTVQVHWVRLHADGRADLDHLEELLAAHPRALVSLMHANNEVGTRNDLQAIGTLCRRHGAIFHSDTVQTMGHYAFDLRSLPVDMLSASAHKFHGPKGVGFLYLGQEQVLRPMIQGGSQERNRRGGTENVAGIVGLAKAMELAYDDLAGHERHVRGLKDHMAARLRAEVPGVGFNGDIGPDSLYTVLSVRFPDDGKAEMLIYHLDIEGIACSGGSACSSGSNAGSHVIAALYPEARGANLRFSFSRYTTRAEIDRTVEVLKKVLEVPSPQAARATV